MYFLGTLISKPNLPSGRTDKQTDPTSKLIITTMHQLPFTGAALKLTRLIYYFTFYCTYAAPRKAAVHLINFTSPFNFIISHDDSLSNRLKFTILSRQQYT